MFSGRGLCQHRFLPYTWLFESNTLWPSIRHQLDESSVNLAFQRCIISTIFPLCGFLFLDQILVRKWQVRNSTKHTTLAIYQSYRCINPSHASHLLIMFPRWAISPRIHSQSYTYTTKYKRTAHSSSCDDRCSIST